MKTIDEYIDEAKAVQGFGSDRELGRALGFKGLPVSQWRTKRSWPSDDTMRRLARMAGADEEIASLDLCAWRTEGDTRAMYQRIAEKIAATAAAIGLAWAVASPSPTYAGTLGEQVNNSLKTLYIMANRLVRHIRAKRLDYQRFRAYSHAPGCCQTVT